MKTFEATILLSTTIKVYSREKKDALEIVRQRIPESIPGRLPGETLTISIDDIHLTELYIMDGSTSHDKSLVNKINMCYANCNNLFYEIVRLLSNRDIDEFDGDRINTNTASMKEIAEYYLHAIADDQDLRAIIEYCRM